MKSIKSDMELGLQKHLSAASQSQGIIQLVPKSWKMVIIIPGRHGETWEGVPVATWCSEWICRMREVLVHHTITISAALSLPLLRGARSRSSNYNISKWLVLYQNIQIFPVSSFSIAFFDCSLSQNTHTHTSTNAHTHMCTHTHTPKSTTHQRLFLDFLCNLFPDGPEGTGTPY